MENQASPDFDEYETVEGLAVISGGRLTEPQIRWALRFRNDNGLNEAVVKLGKRLYIHRPTFMQWFSRQGKAA